MYGRQIACVDGDALVTAQRPPHKPNLLDRRNEALKPAEIRH